MKTEQPLVSILMNCYNGEKYLREAIGSVLTQSHQNWELIFWDNRSTDRSAEICQSYRDARIRYFRSPEHTDLGPARVLACEKMQGEFLSVLDADDIWFPNKLERQLEYFANGQVGVVVSDTIFFNDRGQEKRFYKSRRKPEGRVFERLILDYSVSSETVVIRMKAIQDVGQGFDPKFSHLSDFDLVIRVSEKWKLACVPEVLAKWRVHEGSGTWQEAGRFTREKRFFVNKMDGLHPEEKSKWRSVRRAVIRSIAFNEAKAALLAGRYPECRERLVEFAREERRIRLLYYLSYFPGIRRLLIAYLRFRNVTPG